MTSRKRISIALIGLIALVVFGWLWREYAGTGTEPQPGSSAPVPGIESGLQVSPLSSPPVEAVTTWRLVGTNGPFPHPGKDGAVFGNGEGILPERSSGHYHEYPVPTPGSPDRGARPLVTGESSEVYYTQDHYDSFVVVDVNG